MAPTINQRSQTVKRERAPKAQTPTTLATSETRPASSHATPHDHTSLFLATISSLTRDVSKCREVCHPRSFFETLSQTPSAAAKAEAS
jgi:hypothetical protein